MFAPSQRPFPLLILVAIAIVLAVGVTGPTDAAPQFAGPSTAATVSAEDRQLLDWAVARFELAGLEVPAVDVDFTPVTAGCSGHIGIYQPSRGRVGICVSDSATKAVRRQLVLHELAHVWTHHHLDASAAEGFTALRDASSWNDHEDAWKHRGSEHAAEIIAWGLMDIEAPIKTAGDNASASLSASFTQLTGVAPINDGAHAADDPTDPPAQRVAVRR